jgi:TrmH family RNA methyltransferase
MKAVASRENAGYKAMLRLVTRAGERRKSGLSVLDGPHLLAAFLDSGAQPEELVVSGAGWPIPRSRRWSSAAPRRA